MQKGENGEKEIKNKKERVKAVKRRMRENINKSQEMKKQERKL